MIIRLRWLLLCCSCVILAFTLSYCGGFNLYGTETDMQLGKQLDEEIHKDPKEYPVLNSPAVRQYVQGIVNDLIQSPDVKYKGKFPYQVEIIRDDKTINAFCTPGGYIYVYTGLMKFLDNEATLAGVLGHEIGHAEARHATQRMTKAFGVQVLTGMVLGENPGQAAQIGANLFSGLALLKNSRDDENQSDELSFQYLRTTNKWYAGAAKYFFEKIQKGGQAGGTLERLLSTHPLPQDRIEAFNKRILDAKLPPATESNLFGQRYQQIKRQLP